MVKQSNNLLVTRVTGGESMPYDQSLDEKVFAEVKDFDKTRINISVYSYNHGPKKVQITRENKDSKDVWRYVKLGRLSKEEIEGTLPIIQKALSTM